MYSLLFDLDGTLIESAPDIANALNVVLKDAGRATVTVEETRLLIGEGVARLVEKAFVMRGGIPEPTALAAHVAKMNKLYDAALTVETFLIPHAKEAVASLHQAGHRTAVVSNKPGFLTEQIISHFGLTPHLHAVQGAEDHLPKKPAPDMLFAALEKAGGARESAFMIGDSAIDVAAARNAKIPVILVRGGYTTAPVETLGADLVIDHLGLLADALSRLK
ncbi:MAG: HAD-IA family hydrolase [Hyphomicrobiales bacterium]